MESSLVWMVYEIKYRNASEPIYIVKLEKMQILYKPLKCQVRQDYLLLSSSEVSDTQMPRISRVSRSFQAVRFQPINGN